MLLLLLITIKDATAKSLYRKGISSHLTQPGFLLFMYTNRIYLHLLRGPGSRATVGAHDASAAGKHVRAAAISCEKPPPHLGS